MAAGTFDVYSTAMQGFLNGDVTNLDAVAVTAILLDNTYTPDLDTHDTYSDVSAFELVGGDYVQIAVTTKAVNLVTGDVQFDSDPVTFANPGTITAAKYMVFVQGTAGALNPTDRLIAVEDLDSGGGTVSSTSGVFRVTPPASGWFTVSRAA